MWRWRAVSPRRSLQDKEERASQTMTSKPPSPGNKIGYLNFAAGSSEILLGTSQKCEAAAVSSTYAMLF